MKEAQPISVAHAIERLSEFHAVLDARSPAEHAEDHLPGAVNTPVLDNDERAQVGLLYSQSPFEAKRLGAALVARNIARVLDEGLASRAPRDWSPLVYCWRGGNRSGALATVLARVGWHTRVLEGGYRAFRRYVRQDLDERVKPLQFIVLAGRTGTAKSLLLDALARRQTQVLDLEFLAAHRGSVLGAMPQRDQPSQKQFETLLWQKLRGFNPDQPVFVESESRKVGSCQIPQSLIEAIRRSPCIRIEADLQARSLHLVQAYDHFVSDPQALVERLDHLRSLHGNTVIDDWSALARNGRWLELAERLLSEHYDPSYERSMQRNYAGIERAPRIRWESLAASELDPLLEAIESTGRKLIESAAARVG